MLCKAKGFHASIPDILLATNREDPEKRDYFLSNDEVFMLTKQRAEIYGKLTPVCHTPEPFGCMTADPKRGLDCNGGNCLATVIWDGRMYPCANATVGDGASLLEMSYAEAWEITKAAADSVVHGVECAGCAYDKICPECPSFRLKDLHCGHCNTDICDITRRLVAAGIKKMDQETPMHE